MVSTEAVYDLIVLLGCCVCFTGVVSSCFVPWVHANVVIEQGLFSLTMPLDIGLFKCFSEVCKAYYDVENEGQLSPIDSTFPNPPIGKYTPVFDKKHMQELIRPFENASRVAVVFLVLAVLSAFALFAHLFYVRIVVPILEPPGKQSQRYIEIPTISTTVQLQETTSSGTESFATRHASILERWQAIDRQRRRNMILVVSFFFAFLALLSYVAMTWPSLQVGSYYSEGVWYITYTVLGGLVCALAAAIVLLDHQQQHQRLATSN